MDTKEILPPGEQCADAGPNSPRSPKLGDYVVIAHSWTYELAGPLTRITAQKVFWASKYRERESQTFKGNLLFSGAEAAATLLEERLKSSRALREEEVRGAHLRYQERTQAAVAKAYEAARAAQVGGDGS